MRPRAAALAQNLVRLVLGPISAEFCNQRVFFQRNSETCSRPYERRKASIFLQPKNKNVSSRKEEFGCMKRIQRIMSDLEHNLLVALAVDAKITLMLPSQKIFLHLFTKNMFSYLVHWLFRFNITCSYLT